MKQKLIQIRKSCATMLLILAVCFAIMSFSNARYATKHIYGRLVASAALAGNGAELLYPDNSSDQQMTDALEYLERCVSVYSETKKFSLDVEYSVFYNSENFEKPDDKRHGKIIRNKDDFYQQEMGNIKIMNKDHELILNERSELITIRNRMRQKIEPVIFETDSLARFISRAEKTKDGYVYFMDEGAVEKFEVITYKDGSLKIWRSYYREKMDFGDGEVKVITQLRYNNFDKKPKIDPAVFSLDPYVSITRKGDVEAHGNYKNYYVLNQLQKL